MVPTLECCCEDYMNTHKRLKNYWHIYTFSASNYYYYY